MTTLFLVLLVFVTATAIILIVFLEKGDSEETKEKQTQKRPEMVVGTIVDVFENRRDGCKENYAGRGTIVSRGLFRAQVRFHDGETSCYSIEALAFVYRPPAENRPSRVR